MAKPKKQPRPSRAIATPEPQLQLPNDAAGMAVLAVIERIANGVKMARRRRKGPAS